MTLRNECIDQLTMDKRLNEMYQAQDNFMILQQNVCFLYVRQGVE